jgi:hypothetical protein
MRSGGVLVRPGGVLVAFWWRSGAIWYFPVRSGAFCWGSVTFWCVLVHSDGGLIHSGDVLVMFWWHCGGVLVVFWCALVVFWCVLVIVWCVLVAF